MYLKQGLLNFPCKLIMMFIIIIYSVMATTCISKCVFSMLTLANEFQSGTFIYSANKKTRYKVT